MRGLLIVTFILALFSLIEFAKAEVPVLPFLYYSGDVYKTEKFEKHVGDRPFQSYLAMNLKLDGYAKIRTQLESDLKKILINRNEAHVTVISPTEFDQILKSKVSMDEIDAIAEKMNIEASKIELICVGRGEKTLDGELEQTYFVVVNSPQLVAIRQAVEKEFLKRGGTGFKAEPFYSHVTLGFTKRDLHIEDGVVKDSKSCLYQLKADQ